MTTKDSFTTATTGLLDARGPRTVRLQDRDSLVRAITPVRVSLDTGQLRMSADNGSLPRPTLQVDQGSEITVRATDAADVETTVLWHGLRLQNRYDGAPDTPRSQFTSRRADGDGS